MGEEKKAGKDGGGGGGGDKKKDAGAPAGPQPIVLKVDLHCAGCAGKVRKAIKRAPGVESVTTDMAAGKVVVSGPADAAELKQRIEARAKKPVQIISAGAGPPKKDKEEKKADGGGGDKKADKEKAAGGEKKADKEKGGGGDKKAGKEKGAEKPEEKKPKEPKQETVTLKIRLHCEGCIDRIKRRIYKIKGVKDVTVEAAKDLVKVTGTMDAAALPAYLRDKLSRDVEVVAAGKKDGGGDKKGDDSKDKGAGGGDKKKDGGGGDEKKDKDKSASASVAPTPMADAGMYQMPPPYGYAPYPPAPAGYYGAHHHAGFYPNAAGAQYPPPPAPPTYPYGAAHLHAPQMFSDENPNACSVM
ncbi:hypothetical protein BS78_01G223800 [Paspalum vaginatum]|nr:hypothetical protein BS78_01G223800 [Paspalum vaginatum]